MTAVARQRQYFAGAALGLYAAGMALAPGWAFKAALCVPLVALPLAWWLLREPNRWLLLFVAAAWVLPPLPLALGNSGPHVAILIAGAGLFLGLLRFQDWRFRADPCSVTIAAFLAILMASISMAALYSGAPVALFSLARVLLFGISVYVFFYVRHGPAATGERDSVRMVQVMFWAGAAAALFACVDFYFQFPAPAGYGPQFIWLDSGVVRRAQGFFYEASTLGNFCAFFLVMTAVAMFRGRAARPLPLGVLLAGAPVFATALALSYSRASLVNVVAALAALLWLRRGQIGWKRVLAGAAVFAVAGSALMLVIAPEFSRAYGFRVVSSVQYLFESPDAVLSGRLRTWALLHDFLTNRPWHAFLGVGYKTLPYSDFIGAGAIADNTYLSTLVETGVLGLAALLALLVAILRGSCRAARSSDPHRAFLGAWSLCFWTGQVFQFLSGDLLTYWRVLPAYFCVFALATRGEERA